MLNFNLFETLNVSCLCRKPKVTGDDEEEDDADLKKSLYKMARDYKISVLPVDSNFELANLFPLTNHVEWWNIMIVGRTKEYILASIKDPHTRIPSTGLPNHRGEEALPGELVQLFDAVWTKTLAGRQLQFFLVWNGKLYLINTYPLRNGESVVIGAVMFMRAFAEHESDWASELERRGTSQTVTLDATLKEVAGGPPRA